jgi:DNA-binding transcriptional MerR regulator
MVPLTVHGVRWLARTGQLPYEITGSGQRLFRRADVVRLVAQRATTRLTGLAAAPVGALSGGPRQLSLFGKARLQVVLTKGPLSDARGFPE